MKCAWKSKCFLLGKNMLEKLSRACLSCLARKGSFQCPSSEPLFKGAAVFLGPGTGRVLRTCLLSLLIFQESLDYEPQGSLPAVPIASSCPSAFLSWFGNQGSPLTGAQTALSSWSREQGFLCCVFGHKDYYGDQKLLSSQSF